MVSNATQKEDSYRIELYEIRRDRSAFPSSRASPLCFRGSPRAVSQKQSHPILPRVAFVVANS